MSDVWVSDCGRMELRKGKWQDVLADVTADHCITDPPYGERTHAGQRIERDPRYSTARNPAALKCLTNNGLEYAAATPADVSEICAAFNVSGWFVGFTSHDLMTHYAAALEACGRYVFAPLPAVVRGMNVRLAGDGPSSWTTWIVVSRTRSNAKWGTLPGAYVGSAAPGWERSKWAVRGAKPLWLMRQIVADYSRPGDLIVDPCAGGGTTLLAAAIEGRRAIGAEMDPETFRKAVKRLSAGYTPSLFTGEKKKQEQGSMF